MNLGDITIANLLLMFITVKRLLTSSDFALEKTEFCLNCKTVISQACDFDFETKQTPEMDATINIEPQTKSMEVESQSKVKWLSNKKLLTSDFEATLDGLVGDGQSIISEFVDWESSGPTYTFNELRNALCGEAKICFNADHMYLFSLAYIHRKGFKENLDHQDN